MGIFSKLFTSQTDVERNSFDWILSHIQGLPSSEELKKVADNWKIITDSISDFYDNFKTVDLVVKNVLSKQLENITAADIGARPDTWTPTAEEVGARPATWTPTAENVGAPPVNLGWGGVPTNVIHSLDELDNAKTPGAYRVAINGAVVNNIAFNYALLVVVAYSNDHVHQYLTPIQSDYLIKRTFCNTWGDWGCDNPPMYYNKEYRTGKYFNGKPVYKQCGLSTVTLVGGEQASEHVVDIDIPDMEYCVTSNVQWTSVDNAHPNTFFPWRDSFSGCRVQLSMIDEYGLTVNIGDGASGLVIRKIMWDLEYTKK